MSALHAERMINVEEKSFVALNDEGPSVIGLFFF